MEDHTYAKLRNLTSISLRNLNLNYGIGDDRYRLSSIEDVAEDASTADVIDKGDLQLIKKSKMIVNSNVLDSFFSLHIPTENGENLIYLSEVRTASSCPDFQPISLPDMSDEKLVVLKIWTKFTIARSWILFSSLLIHLDTLIFIGTCRSQTENCFRHNSIIFDFNCRVYTLPMFLNTPLDKIRAYSEEDGNQKSAEKSYSFDSIRSLNTMLKSTSDICTSKDSIGCRISEELQLLTLENSFYVSSAQEAKSLFGMERLENIIKQKNSEQESLFSDVVSLQVRIDKLKNALKEIFPREIEAIKTKIELTSTQCDPLLEDLASIIYPSIAERLLQISSIISEMIQIRNEDKNVRFSIMGLEFPSSIKELLEACYYNKVNLKDYNYPEIIRRADNMSHSSTIDHINACLGYIVFTMNILADITGVDMPYPMIYNCSNSRIIDPISPTRISSQAQLHRRRQDSKGVTDESPFIYLLYYVHDHSIKASHELELGDHNVVSTNFEVALSLLNRNMSTLVSEVVNGYNNIHTTGSKQGGYYAVPPDCLDNFLWNIQFILLFLSAPNKRSKNASSGSKHNKDTKQ